jgi:hypothetical protein
VISLTLSVAWTKEQFTIVAFMSNIITHKLLPRCSWAFTLSIHFIKRFTEIWNHSSGVMNFDTDFHVQYMLNYEEDFNFILPKFDENLQSFWDIKKSFQE